MRTPDRESVVKQLQCLRMGQPPQIERTITDVLNLIEAFRKRIAEMEEQVFKQDDDMTDAIQQIEDLTRENERLREEAVEETAKGRPFSLFDLVPVNYEREDIPADVPVDIVFTDADEEGCGPVMAAAEQITTKFPHLKSAPDWWLGSVPLWKPDGIDQIRNMRALAKAAMRGGE